jgi:hypothetical protein
LFLFTDAGVLAAAGFGCVFFGRGVLALALTSVDWVAVCQLELGTALVAIFLHSLA